MKVSIGMEREIQDSLQVAKKRMVKKRKGKTKFAFTTGQETKLLPEDFDRQIWKLSLRSDSRQR